MKKITSSRVIIKHKATRYSCIFLGGYIMPFEDQEKKLSEIKEEMDILEKQFPYILQKPKTMQDCTNESLAFEKHLAEFKSRHEELQNQIKEQNYAPDRYTTEELNNKMYELEKDSKKTQDQGIILKQYMKHVDLRQKYNSLNREISHTVAQMRAAGNNPNYKPGGNERGCIPVNFSNLFNALTKDELKIFCDQHELTIVTQNQEKTIFSRDGKEKITVDKDSVTMVNSPGETQEELVIAVRTMLAIYLKGLKGETVMAHNISSTDPAIQKCIGTELASKLQKLNITSAKINGKMIQEILNPEPIPITKPSVSMPPETQKNNSSDRLSTMKLRR